MNICHANQNDPLGKEATYIERVIQIEVKVAVEVTPNEFVDLRLGGRVQVLEFVHRLELDDVQAVGNDTVRLSFEQMLRLVRRDMGDSGKNVSTVRSRAFDAVSVVNAAFPCFVVDIEVLEIVVKVDRPSA